MTHFCNLYGRLNSCNYIIDFFSLQLYSHLRDDRLIKMTINLPLNDSAVLDALAKGDPVAFRNIYEKFNKRIYTVALKMLQAKETAEEVTQEVFLKLWLHNQRFNDLDHLEAWLRTTTRNLSLNAFRKMALERKLDQQAFIQFNESQNATEETVLLNDARRQLDAAIQKLPAQQREVYVLCQQDGLKYEEVADRLNISVNTVKTHMKRAISSVRLTMKSNIDLTVLAIILKLF